MPTDFRISDLPTSIPFNNLDIMEVSQVDSNSPSGYSSVQKTMEEIGEKLNNDIQYASSLATTNKKIIGAINELKSALTVTDVKTSITWNESLASGSGAYQIGNMLFITYQGESATHTETDTLFVLPSGLRPVQNWIVNFVEDDKTFGTITIHSSNGKANINKIADNTQTGRVYFSISFPIA